MASPLIQTIDSQNEDKWQLATTSAMTEASESIIPARAKPTEIVDLMGAMMADVQDDGTECPRPIPETITGIVAIQSDSSRLSRSLDSVAPLGAKGRRSK